MVISVDCVLCGSVIPLTVTPPLDVLPSASVVVLRVVVVGTVVGAKNDINESFKAKMYMNV